MRALGERFRFLFLAAAIVGCSQPAPPVAPLDRAAQALQTGNWEAAIESCNIALVQDEANNQAYTLRGRAYQGRGDLDRAIADFSQAIRLAPNAPDAYYSRAIAYRKLGRTREAVEDDVRGRQIDPNYFREFVHLPDRQDIRRNAKAVARAREAAKKEGEEEEQSLPAFRSWRNSRAKPGAEPAKNLAGERESRSSRRAITSAASRTADVPSEGGGYAARPPLELPERPERPSRSERTAGDFDFAYPDAGPPLRDLERGAASPKPNSRGGSPSAGTGDTRRRTARTPSANERRLAGADQFEPDEQETAPSGRFTRERLGRPNPFAEQGRTPFSGRRTTLYDGSDPNARRGGSIRGQRVSDYETLDGGSRAVRRRPDPFREPGATPFSAPRRRPPEAYDVLD